MKYRLKKFLKSLILTVLIGVCAYIYYKIKYGV